jgi:hypothetical protein
MPSFGPSVTVPGCLERMEISRPAQVDVESTSPPLIVGSRKNMNAGCPLRLRFVYWKNLKAMI